MTKRTYTELQTNFADNTSGAILPSMMRDFAESVSGSRRYTAVSATTTLDNNHDIVGVDATGGARTINLPAAASNAHKIYTVIKVDSSANAVTLDGSGSEVINSATTYALAAQYNRVTIICTGSAWLIIGT